MLNTETVRFPTPTVTHTMRPCYVTVDIHRESWPWQVYFAFCCEFDYRVSVLFGKDYLMRWNPCQVCFRCNDQTIFASILNQIFKGNKRLEGLLH